MLRDDDNSQKSINSDWEVELKILDKNTNSDDLKEAFRATFKVASVVLSFLPNKKSGSSTLTDKAYSEHLRYSWEDRPYESENREL